MLKNILICEIFLISTIGGVLTISKNAISREDEVQIEWEKVNVTKLISVIPKDIKEVFDNITSDDTLHIQNILYSIYNFVISNKTSVGQKLWIEMINKSTNITKNGKDFLKKLIQFHYTVLEHTIGEDGTTIDYKKLREEVYQIAQEYLNLTNADRESFASSFPTLSNFFNNKILLDALRGIQPNSSIKDYINIRNRLINAIIEKKFSK